MSDPQIPKELDAIVDVILAYKPKPNSKSAKKANSKQISSLKTSSSGGESAKPPR